MKQLLLIYLEKKKLCTSTDKILLAVSGGMDSMVMLRLFQECGFNIGVAHVNFQLRGDESEGDEKFVAAYCEQFSIPFFTKKHKTEWYAQQNHLSIQMAARELRYQWFYELLNDHHFDCIATAHHLNDSIETVVLNLTRGSGLKGWDGIESKNKKVIRPMLFATRQEIESYAKENKITWREDRSNITDDYSRNFIRHQVIPKLKEINPSLENLFSESMEKIAGAVEWMELGIRHWREKFETKKGEQILLSKEGFGKFEKAESALWNLIKGYGFNFDQCHQIIKSIHGQPGKKFSSSSHNLVIDRDHLILSKNEAELGETLIQYDQTEATLGHYKLTIERKEKMDLINDPNLVVLDANKITFPLRWRKWKPGDSFHPLGMNHKKKLSDFLIDQKISVAEKETITVLESADEIVWVVGLRMDDRYKVIEATQSTVACRLTTVD